MTSNDLELELAEYVIGHTAVEDLPSIASAWLQRGLSSDALRRLALCSNQAPPILRDLLARGVSELGHFMPSLHQAGMTIARSIAAEVLNGAITPYRGAKRIWTEVYLRLPALKQLCPFVGLASAYEEDAERAASYSQQIVMQCELLTRGGSSHAA